MSPLRSGEASRGISEDDNWLEQFHSGTPNAMEALYREHFVTVSRAVSKVLYGADKETVIHEVFYRLLTTPETRLGFKGGSLAPWLSTLARNQAIDCFRRRQLEI